MCFVTHNLAFKMSNFGPLYLCRSLRQVSNSQKRAPEVSISNKLTKRQPLEKLYSSWNRIHFRSNMSSHPVKLRFLDLGKCWVDFVGQLLTLAKEIFQFTNISPLASSRYKHNLNRKTIILFLKGIWREDPRRSRCSFCRRSIWNRKKTPNARLCCKGSSISWWSW